MNSSDKPKLENGPSKTAGSNLISLRPPEDQGTSKPESGPRIVALQLDILELERQVASLSEALETERARTGAAGSTSAGANERIVAIEIELRDCTAARDTASAVAAAAVAELRTIRATCESLRAELETVRQERDAALRAARALELGMNGG